MALKSDETGIPVLRINCSIVYDDTSSRLEVGAALGPQSARVFYTVEMHLTASLQT